MLSKLKAIVNATIGAGAVALAMQATASPINVLWYTWAHPNSDYRTGALDPIVADAANSAYAAGNTWNITFWANGSATVIIFYLTRFSRFEPIRRG